MDREALLVINRPSVIFDAQGGETVVIDLAIGHYYRLDEPSSRFWSMLESPFSIEGLASSCENADDAGSLQSIVADLVERGLVRAATAGDGDARPRSWRFDGFTLELYTDLEDILGLDPIHEVDPAQGWPNLPSN